MCTVQHFSIPSWFPYSRTTPHPHSRNRVLDVAQGRDYKSRLTSPAVDGIGEEVWLYSGAGESLEWTEKAESLLQRIVRLTGAVGVHARAREGVRG